MDEYIKKETAYRAIMGERPEAREPSWFAELVLEIPAADVAPVQHGRWNRPYISWFLPIKIKNPHCFCTNCAYPMKHKRVTRYCPNCGARMDGDGNG